MINFPSSPTDGQQYTNEGRSWEWSASDGAWLLIPVSTADAVSAAASAASAGASKVAAAASEAAAEISETNAAASESAAAASQSAAATSETNAAASELAAGLSEDAAAASEASASTSASTATTKAAEASTSAANALASEQAAAASEAAAGASEAAAAASEATALKTLPFFGAAPPASPLPNAEWINTTTGRRYTWLNDGTSTQWVEAGSTVVVDEPTFVNELSAALAANDGSGLVGFVSEYLAAKDRTMAEKAGETVSALDFKADGVTNVGVDPTGSIDSTVGIQAFFDAPLAHKIMPPGTYAVSAQLWISKADSIYFDNVTLLYTGSGSDVLKIAPAVPGALINRLTLNGHLIIERQSVDFNDEHAGVYIEALYSSEIWLSVKKFARGMHMHGNGTRGVAYNKFFIGEMANCKYSQYFTSAPDGWVNINTFYGGRYYGGTVGMLSHIEMDTTNYEFNGNKWMYPSLESSVAGHYLFNLKGLYNEIFVGYAEHDGGTLPWALVGGTYNAVHSTAPYMSSARFNDATARLNITGTYCTFYGGGNDLRSSQAEMSRYITASNTLPAARFENSSASGVSALDVQNSNNGTINSFRILNQDGTVGVALSASGRAWQVKANTSGTIKKSILWTETVAPTTGTWMRGDIAFFTNPSAGGAIGAVCTAGGTPGTWVSFGQVGVAGSIGSTPSYVGQLAVASGIGYMAVGVASSADWKQITA